MPTSAAIGYNTIFSIYNGSAYVAVSEVTSITWPGYARDAIDATTMSSEDRHREFIAGLIDAGEVTIEMNYVPSHADVVLAALLSSTTGAYKITANSGVNVTFNAIVTAYAPQAPVDDKMTASATFKITGKPVYAAS